MLKIEDLKVGDELECIDVSISNLVNKGDVVKISWIDEAGFRIEGDNDYWNIDWLSSFKKKEQSQYTFGYLIDVAFQAKKDGVVCEVIWNDFLSVSGISLENQIVVASDQVSSDFICDAIKAIKSLYKETFVIECEEDINRIKIKSEVTLTNGNTFIVDNVSDKFITPSDSFDTLTILSLKGAKVEQSK